MQDTALRDHVKNPRIVAIVPGNSENRLVIDMVSTFRDRALIVSVNGPDVFLRDACKDLGIGHEVLGLNFCPNAPRRQIRIIKFLAELPPSTILLHSYPVYKQFLIATILFNSKHVFSPVRHHNRLHALQHRKATLAFEALLPLVFRNWIAVSEVVRRTIMESIVRPRSVAVIHNGVPQQVNSRTFHVTESKINIVSAGRISWEKNYMTQILIASELKKRGVNFCWVIYGEGSKQSLGELERKAASLGVLENFEFVGYRSDFTAQIASYDVLVHTSLDEACPLVIIEALIHGTYVVSSNAGGCQEILSSFYPTYPPLDVQAFSEAIYRVSHERALFKKQAINNIENAARLYSARLMSKSYKDYAETGSE